MRGMEQRTMKSGLKLVENTKAKLGWRGLGRGRPGKDGPADWDWGDFGG